MRFPKQGAGPASRYDDAGSGFWAQACGLPRNDAWFVPKPPKKKAGGSKLRTGQVMGLEGEVSVVETVAENAGQLGLARFTVLLQRR